MSRLKIVFMVVPATIGGTIGTISGIPYSAEGTMEPALDANPKGLALHGK
jgi:hypothetical protein